MDTPRYLYTEACLDIPGLNPLQLAAEVRALAADGRAVRAADLPRSVDVSVGAVENTLKQAARMGLVRSVPGGGWLLADAS